MKRSRYFESIEEKLYFLAYRIEMRGKLNILNLNLHSENFYLRFLNVLFGWKLANLNEEKQNVAAIDLIDESNTIIAQVSATATKTKVESALTKDLSKYKGYSFKFVSISKDADSLRSKTYKNPWNLLFNPKTDILDIHAILKKVLHLDVGHQKNLWNLIEQELGGEIDPHKVETNLAAIIDFLSKEDWSQDDQPIEIQAFEIDKKITYNQLNAAKVLIDDYKIHAGRIERIYGEFDRLGANKSLSVLDGIRREYLREKDHFQNADELFFKIIDFVRDRIRDSANFTPIPNEELELCVEILVVDAFIRCKIFENPEGVANAAS